ncbi:MAG: bifunctional diaminohydroxyphosphoribosylaminopyrimidine deaminase/5-amino-6-(5-phosphoribosylamino)uracil reductase RibD [Bacteriovoracaceae bacterium]
MKLAFLEAMKGQGIVSPNPLVGSVITLNNLVIGTGFHHGPGLPHAEIMAIKNAKENGHDLAGATLYCNLEPCCHTNKLTPPCAPEIISSGIKTVVISNLDPNPHVFGKGVEALKAGGLEVITGIEEKEGAVINEIFFKYIQTKLPFIHLKMGQTLDGKIATSTGDSKYITGEQSLKRVHETRYAYDAVLVGANTFLLDNPKLTIRNTSHEIPSQPYRVALSKLDKINFTHNLISDDFASKTIIVTTHKDYMKNSGKVKMLSELGVDVLSLQEDSIGKINLQDLLKELGERKITSLVVEGGSSLYTQFLNLNLFDKVSIFIAPIIIGQGKSTIGDLFTESLSEAIRFYNTSFESLGADILFTGYRKDL